MKIWSSKTLVHRLIFQDWSLHLGNEHMHALGTSLITSFKMTTGSHQRALALLELLAFLTLASAVTSENKLRFEIDNKDGSYQAFLSDKLWFNSGPVAFRNNGKWSSTDDGSLKLHNHSKTTGQDAWGEYKSHEVWWQTTDCLCYLMTRFNVYQHEPVVSFASVFASGAVHAAANNTDSIVSAFPTFLIEELGLQRAYLTYYGSFAADIHIDKWSPSSPPPGGIDGGLPLAVFDSDMQNTVVISPLSGFMSAGQETWEPKDKQPLAFSLGLLGTIDTIPPLYEYKSFMVVGDNITGTMQKWGELLQKQSGKDGSYRKTDHTLNYLGYWTDHGSCYWYNTGDYTNYEELLVAVKENADFEGIPFGYLQLDSWWYYKGLQDGVKNWTAVTDLFPSGIDAVVKKTGWPIMAHNRYWSSNTDYAKLNGGKFDFVVEGDLALPNDPNFWRYLLSMGQADWGLQVYEQDWLYVQYSGMKDILGSLFLGESWLKEMGLAAQELGLTIQYCMPWTRHMMASVEIPVVTQVRVSGDYQPGSKQWMVGDTAILAHALGLASFKDTFQTGPVESHCATKTTETHPILETYIAALSGGPVGIGDAIGNFNKTLIMATCMSDGHLLKPTRPALSIDASFLFRAFGGDGPDGPVYVAYTEVRPSVAMPTPSSTHQSTT